MNHVRWGLLSTANINRRLIPAIRASKRGSLVAVASRSTESAEAYARQWNIPQSFGSYQEMLDSGKVDAVYIGLPNHLHAEWSIKAMQAGIAVLCEKPFAISMNEVDAMIATHKETGVPLAEAFMYRHHPQTKITGEWVQGGKLGTISLVRGIFNFSMPDPDTNVRMKPELGGGSLWDVGVYPLSFGQYVMNGAPEWVFGSQWLGPSGVDETFAGQMGYSGGTLGQISSSFRTPFYTFFEIIGTEGRLQLTHPFTGQEDPRCTLTFIPKNGSPEDLPVPEFDLYTGEVEDMHAAILDKASNYLTLEETRNHVKTTLALYESAKSGQVVHLK